MTDKEKINYALECAARYGGIDGGHHKMWVIDQMVRALTDCSVQTVSSEYLQFVAQHNAGADGPETYAWDVGIAP